jgi:YD repeat-containing protein
MRNAGWFLVLATGAAALVGPAPGADSQLGNETVNYSYDELGRLTGSNTTGGPNDTRTTGTCFDAAGNRVRYDVANAAPAACPTPPPP